MASDHLVVKLLKEQGNEDAYFREQDRKRIEQLREKNLRETNDQYQEEHRYHCFRCGTPSLVEIERDKVVIDICVNEGCGAIHLDPGELDQILGASNSVTGVRKALFSVFK